VRKIPFSFLSALVLVSLNALVWLFFAGIVALGIHPSLPDEPISRWGMAAISLLTGCLLIVLTIFLNKKKRTAYFLTVAALTIESVAFFFDDFGLSDLVFFILTLLPILLLIINRRWYFDQNR